MVHRSKTVISWSTSRRSRRSTPWPATPRSTARWPRSSPRWWHPAKGSGRWAFQL